MLAQVTLFYPILHRRAEYTKGSNYTDYREEISEDCQHRCVYCDIHENVLGGYESMQLDHFYPQSRYPDRINDPLNLVWVCGRCNLLKRADWYDIDYKEIHTAAKGYLDPFAVNRTQFFLVKETGEIKSISGPAEYMIKRLKLNRSFLTRARRARRVVHEFVEMVESYFAQLLDEHAQLLQQQVIDLSEYQRRIGRDNEMKRAMLEIINTIPLT